MAEIVQEILKQFPWVAWLLIIAIVLVIAFIVMAMYASARGRSVKVGPITIGEEKASSIETPPSQVFNINPVQVSDEQMEQRASKFAEQVQELEREHGSDPDSLTYEPPDPPDFAVRFYKIKVDIRNRLRNIVSSQGGSWAGITLSDAETILDVAATSNYVSKELAGKIGLFFWEIRPYMDGESPLDDTSFQIHYLENHIIEELEKIEATLERG